MYPPQFLVPINLTHVAQQHLPKVGTIQVTSVGLNLWFSTQRARREVHVIAEMWYGGRLEGLAKDSQPFMVRSGVERTGVWTNVPPPLCDALGRSYNVVPSAVLDEVRRSDAKFDAWVSTLEDGSFWIEQQKKKK